MRKMKDSGVEWIGEIPINYNTTSIGTLFSIKKDIIGREPETVLSITQTGIKPKDLSSNEGQNASSYAHYQIVNEGDFAMNHMDLLTGWIDISKYEGVTSPDYRVFVLDDKVMSTNYFLRVFQYYYTNRVFFGFGQGVATLGRWRLPAVNFKKIVVPVPPVQKQHKIADAIDKETEKVDLLIANVQSQIEKLKAYKRNLITEVVTKGLDSSVAMKDSGVEWIGNVPAHWTIIRLKHLYDHSNGSPVRVGPFGSALPSSELTDEGVWVYNQRTVLDQNFESNNTFVSEKKADELSGFAVYPKDILVTTRGSIGKTAIVPDGAPRGVLHPCVIRFRIDNKKMNSELLSCIFNETNICLGQIMDMSNSTTIEVLYSYSLKEIWMPCPPIAEQKAIYQRICDLIQKFDRLIAIKQAKIEKLEQYNRSLIYEYVTGKREVL